MMLIMEEKLKPLLIALKAEKQAIAYYARAARRITNPTGKEALKKIKSQEENHYKNLKAKFKKLAGRGLKRGEEDQVGSVISGLTEQHIPDREASDIEVCQIAIKDEHEAHAFYHKSARNAPDESTRKLYEELAAEETRHAATLKQICKILSQ
jgi:rubrerythrin